MELRVARVFSNQEESRDLKVAVEGLPDLEVVCVCVVWGILRRESETLPQ